MGAAESKLPTPDSTPGLDFEGLDFYAILGISQTFSEEELKQAYRARAKETHPDKDHTDGSTERFKKVLEAYETLKSPQSRAKYNEKLRQENAARNSETSPSPTPQNAPMPGQNHSHHEPQPYGASSPGWFSWIFDSFAFTFHDPLLRYVPETYIAQNRGTHRPQGMSVKEIIYYLDLCSKDKTINAEKEYPIIGNLFQCIAFDEKMWGSENHIPHYGFWHSGWSPDEEPSMAHYAADFYRYWLVFETKKTFDWVNPYQTDGYSHRVQRQVKRENERIQMQCRKQYDGLIRELTASLLHRDARCARYLELRVIRSGVLLSMKSFCEQFIKRVQARKGDVRAGSGKHQQTKSQKKRQKRKKKSN